MVRVNVELEFEHLNADEVSEADVINYLQELIDNGIVGFEVIEE